MGYYNKYGADHQAANTIGLTIYGKLRRKVKEQIAGKLKVTGKQVIIEGPTQIFDIYSQCRKYSRDYSSFPPAPIFKPDL